MPGSPASQLPQPLLPPPKHAFPEFLLLALEVTVVTAVSKHAILELNLVMTVVNHWGKEPK